MSGSEELTSGATIMIDLDDQLHHIEKHPGINNAYPGCGEKGISRES